MLLSVTRIEAGFSFKDWPKRAENTPGRHHAHSYHRFRGILLQLSSVRPTLKSGFPFSLFSTALSIIAALASLSHDLKFYCTSRSSGDIKSGKVMGFFKK